jgi:putative oxidoreductase
VLAESRGKFEETTMKFSRFEQVAYALLRGVAGLLFLQVGSKLFLGWFGGVSDTPGTAAPLMSQMGVGGALEFFGGILILLGLCTRPVAFVLSGEMAVAYWQFHAPNGAWPILNHGELAVLFCFIFLYMVARGGGEWSLDALIRRKRGAGAPL